MGNSFNKGRAVHLSTNPAKRIPKDEYNALKEAFNRIQNGQLINESQFHIDVMGTQSPEQIAIKVFQLFATNEKYEDAMNFEDILACYAVFKYGTIEEMAQVYFELIRMTGGALTQGLVDQSEFISNDHIKIYIEKMLGQNEQLVHSFYAKTSFDPRIPIQKKDFIESFRRIQQHDSFTWVQKLLEGYSADCMNMDESGEAVDVQKRLTMIQNDRARSEADRLGFTKEEQENMQEFINREMKKNDAKAVLNTIEFMFGDIQNEKLRKYFVDSITRHKALDFKALSNLSFFLYKEQVEVKKLSYLFDIFSCNSDMLNKKQMRDFAEVFNLGDNFFQSRGAQMKREEFIEDTQNLQITFSLYEKCKPRIIGMLALKANTPEIEKEAILSVLDYNHNIEDYIHSHLEIEDAYYVMNKRFFDAWSSHVGYSSSLEKSSFLIKKEERLKVIDNQSLVEPLHQYRFTDSNYGVDYIIVPRFVFFPLSKWYSCNKIIERKVIQYKQDHTRALNLFKTKKLNMTQLHAGLQQPPKFTKQIGDVTFELEVAPKFIYFEKITENGERPHEKAIHNQKIDPRYLKKMKIEKIPFFELLVSRKATFEEVLKQISTQLGENAKRGRLWIEDQIISGANLGENLEEFGISMGQVVYVEYATTANQWPTDNYQRQTTSLTSTLDRREIAKTTGLYNLGNTCYMNSALQCLANTKFFMEFFSEDKKYLKQMNLTSKLGHQGELVQTFASLIQTMYNQQHVVYPRDFKKCLSKISDQFQGYDQQDSQEFLAFLLDGLHEELNLRQVKPHIEDPSSDNRDENELALEMWANTLRRDWSFIYFMLFGQQKSIIQCNHCGKKSVKFDNFNSIQLPLPEPSKILINIVIYRLPSDIKNLLNGVLDMNNGKRSQQQLDSRQDSFGSDDAMTTIPVNTKTLRIDGEGSPLHKRRVDTDLNDNIVHIMNNQPIKISLRVEKDAQIHQIINQICGIKEVNIDPQSKKSALLLYAQSRGIIRGIFNSDLKLTQYQVSSTEIEAIEIVTKTGRDFIRDLYQENKEIVEFNQDLLLRSLTQPSAKVLEESKKEFSSIASVPYNKSIGGKSQNRDSNYGLKLDRFALYNSYYSAVDKFEEFDQNSNFPDDIFTLAYHRRFVKKQHSFFCQFQPQIISSPLLILMPLKPTGRRVYEEVWAVASNILKKSSIYHDYRNRWWEQRNWEEKFNNVKKETFKPFILKTVDRTGYTCSSCHWTKKCSGCPLSPSYEYIDDFFLKIHLVIEWHSSLIEEDYNQQVNEVIQHSSTEDRVIQDDGHINLDDCLRKYQEPEEMGSANHINCSTCLRAQPHMKKLEIFRPPPVLIVQLKRFRFQNNLWNKLNTQVEFPLYNLDLSSFVSDPDFVKNTLDIEPLYDLYAFINHFGTLSGGHYVSVVKNFTEKKWYIYDDSHRSILPEDQISKDHAYILFYIRKDVQQKTMDSLFPHIKDIFPGKPIETVEKGLGFVLDQQDDGSLKVQYQTNAARETEIIGVGNLKEEIDQDEIHYDARQMQEIESQKKEKLKESMKKGSHSKCHIKGRCKAMFSNMRIFRSYSAATVGISSKRQYVKQIKRGGVKSSMMTRSGENCAIF